MSLGEVERFLVGVEVDGDGLVPHGDVAVADGVGDLPWRHAVVKSDDLDLGDEIHRHHCGLVAHADLVGAFAGQRRGLDAVVGPAAAQGRDALLVFAGATRPQWCR